MLKASSHSDIKHKHDTLHTGVKLRPDLQRSTNTHNVRNVSAHTHMHTSGQYPPKPVHYRQTAHYAAVWRTNLSVTGCPAQVKEINLDLEAFLAQPEQDGLGLTTE